MSNYSQINFADIEPTSAEGGFELRFSRKHIESRDPGSGRALLDGEVVDVRQGDVVRVAPPTVRAFEASAEGLELIAVGGPKPEGGDGEIVEAEWPDA